jgi:hypothetical protein
MNDKLHYYNITNEVETTVTQLILLN